MKYLTIVVCSALLASCATQKADPYADLSDTELESRFSAAKNEQPLPYCQKLVPLTKAMLQRDDASREKQAFKHYAMFECALDEGRFEDAYRSMQRYERLSGRSMGGYGFNLAYFAGHYEDAVERLEAIGPDNYSSDIFTIDSDLFWQFFSRVESEGDKSLQKRAIDAMVESPYLGGLRVGFRSGLAAQKLRFEVQAGNFDGSDQWIAHILRPNDYVSMLADRRFEPIWPALENAVGEHFAAINERHLKAVRQAYQNDSSDRQAYQRLAHALVFAGRFEEVIELVKTPAEGEFAALEEEEAWALNMKVNALDSLGRVDEATALFENLATIPVTAENRYWLISFTINRAARLAGFGQWGKALEAADYAERFSGSAYAKMIIRRVKACARVNLGMGANRLLGALYEHRADSYTNAAMAMLCAGNEDRATEVLLEGMADESSRGSIVASLQDPRFSLYAVRPQTPQVHHLLDKNETLRQGFESEARQIPETYIPAARLKRF